MNAQREFNAAASDVTAVYKLMRERGATIIHAIATDPNLADELRRRAAALLSLVETAVTE